MVSPQKLQKTVTVGLGNLGMPNVIQFVGTITIPNTQTITAMRLESPTPYLNSEFNTFWSYDPSTGNQLQQFPPAGQENESTYPTILSTSDGSYAMGIYSPDLPQPGHLGNAYVLNNYIQSNPGSPCSKIAAIFYSGNMPPGNIIFIATLLLEISKPSNRK